MENKVSITKEALILRILELHNLFLYSDYAGYGYRYRKTPNRELEMSIRIPLTIENNFPHGSENKIPHLIKNNGYFTSFFILSFNLNEFPSKL